VPDTVNGVTIYTDEVGQRHAIPTALLAAVQAAGGSNASAPAITSTFSLAQAVDGTNPTLVSGSPVSLISVDAYNARTNGVSIQFFDKASVPASGDTPKWTVYMPGLTPASRVYPTGIRFSSGLAIALVPDDAPGLMAGDIQGLNLGYAA